MFARRRYDKTIEDLYNKYVDAYDLAADSESDWLSAYHSGRATAFQDVAAGLKEPWSFKDLGITLKNWWFNLKLNVKRL